MNDIITDCLKNDPLDPLKRKKCLDDFINDGCKTINTYYDIFKSKMTQDQYNSIRQQLIEYSNNFNENNDSLTTIYISKTNCTINALNRIFNLTGDQALKPIDVPNVYNKLNLVRENFTNTDTSYKKNTFMNIILFLLIILSIIVIILFFFRINKKVLINNNVF